mmetsp:Transcript_8450/g.31204  ORF Transcript_8450/g.31204 Transcript_8450/m.31204 type:complete len:931 (+) Transcript_8450:153-2945(+)
MAAGEPPRRLLWLWFLCLLLVGTQQPAGGQQGYPRPTTAKDKQRLEEVVPQTSGADSVAGAELVPSLPGVPEESSLLLVTLLDGSLNAIDSQTGELKWTFGTGSPLVTSSRAFAKPEDGIGHVTDDGDYFFPGVDGTLYTIADNVVERLPMSAQELVHNSPSVSYSSGTYLVGSRSSSVFALDPSTGKQVANRKAGERSDGSPHILVGRTEYFVEAFDAYTQEPKWNLSVSELAPLGSGGAPQHAQQYSFPGGSATGSNVDVWNGNDGHGAGISEMEMTSCPELIATGNKLHGTPGSQFNRDSTMEWSFEFSSSPVSAFVVTSRAQHSRESHTGASQALATIQLMGPQDRFGTTGGLMISALRQGGGVDAIYSGGEFRPEVLPSAAMESSEFYLVGLPSERRSLNGNSFGVGPDNGSGVVSQWTLSEGLQRALGMSSGHVADPSTSDLVPVGHLVEDGDNWECAPMTTSEAYWPSFMGGLIHEQQYVQANGLVIPPSYLGSDAMPKPTQISSTHALVGSLVAGLIGLAATVGMLWVRLRGQSEAKTTDPKRVKSNATKKERRKSKNSSKQKGKLTEEHQDPGKQDAGVERPRKERSIRGDVVHVGRLRVDTQKVLGKGSHGTVVYEGTFDGRPVAVKRFLAQFYETAAKEIETLIISDEHPNVLRCYAMEEDKDFVYLALEKCESNLAELIEEQGAVFVRHFFAEGSSGNSGRSNLASLQFGQNLSPECMRLLADVVSGLAHLHSMGVVHRDLKPQNVLVTKSGRAKLADMGISKKLDADQSSFDTLASSGTFGWQAPEQLLKSSRMSSSDDSSSTRGASSGTLRLTRGIDIFSLGCLIFYVLSEGKHPFGERFERNTNILRGIPDLSALKGEFPEAFDLVSAMLAYNSRDRPSATAAAAHPFFWSLAKRLRFLVGMPSLCQHRQCPIVA